MTIYSDDQKNPSKLEVVQPEPNNPEITSQALSDADKQAFLNTYFKQLTVGEISHEIKQRTNDTIQTLQSLQKEIALRKQGTIAQGDVVKQKLEQLERSGKVNIDKREFESLEKGVKEFVSLLDKMIDEVQADINFYESLLSSTPPEKVLVLKNESDNFDEHLLKKIASAKKYVKNAKRDLIVSYSRYCFGFDVKMRQISYVEQALKNAATNSAVPHHK